MESLSRLVSTRMADMTKKRQAHRLVHDDFDSPFCSFAPPTYADGFGAHSNNNNDITTCIVRDAPSLTKAERDVNEKEKRNGTPAKNIMSAVRRFSPFPGRNNSGEEYLEGREPPEGSQACDTRPLQPDPATARKDSKYRRLPGNQGTDGELAAAVDERSGMRKLTDTAMNKVERFKKGRRGEYGKVLLDEEE